MSGEEAHHPQPDAEGGGLADFNVGMTERGVRREVGLPLAHEVLNRCVTVVGVHPAPDMLRLARARTTGGCIRAAAEHLPFRADSFDLTLAVTVLEFVADPAAAVAELARVTRGGGRIVVGALNLHSPWGLANRRRLRTGVRCHARVLDPGDLRSRGAPHGRTSLPGAPHAPGDLPGLSRLGSLLEIAGRAAPASGAFQVLVIDKDRHP